MYAVPVYSRKLLRILWILCGIGVVVMFIGLLGFESRRVWITYLVNFCFWSGLAQAGIVFSAAYRLTNGRWGESIRRVSEGFVLFVPLTVLLFLATYAGRHLLWPWIDVPVQGKEAWLNEPLFFGRVTVYYLALSFLSLRYVYVSVRPEIGLVKEQGMEVRSVWVDRLTAKWKGYAVEAGESERRLGRLVPAMLIAYAVLYTLVGFDVVMSLDPRWTSTLYGWLYFVHAFNAGVACTIIVAILARKYFRLGEHVSTSQFYDVSRLLMGICMLAGGFYWGQYITIWYGNLGEEINRLIVRFFREPWPAFQWGVIILLYFFPIAVFLSRSVKERPRWLLGIAAIILTANWFYQFIEIAPSIWTENRIPLGWIEAAVTAGFLGCAALCWLAYARIVPLVPFAPVLQNDKH